MSAPSTSPISLLMPPFVAFLRNAAMAFQTGRHEAYALWLEAATHLHATDDASISDLVSALISQAALEEAIAVAEAATQLYPDSAASGFRLGYALQIAGRHADALTPYRQAMACDPDYPQLRNNLAAAIRLSEGNLDEQRMLLEQAIEVHPQDSLAWINLIMARRDAFDLAGALAAGQQALELVPGDALAHNNYAIALKEAQRWDEAEACAQAACKIVHGDASHRHNLSILHLVRGNYAQGWAEHESRWEGSQELSGRFPELPGPRWNGEPLAGKTLLVWGEQGMGDLLQFCRLIPQLAERVHRENGRIEWNSFPQMGGLLTRSLGRYVDGFTAGGGVDALPHFDYHLPLLSVPFMLGLREETIPPAPYLKPDPALATSWKTRLKGEKRLKVGLAWTGSMTHQRNPFRRVGWERYARSLKDIKGVAFYSLQPGATADIEAARAAGLLLEDYTAEFRTFDDTAAFVSALDLVITVCTSVAHLSGALGRPTWVLLDTNPHWPWLLDRRDSPWYPRTRLYRQAQFAQWDPVLQDVAGDLSQFARNEGR
ncbi:hypothetical protein FAZ95_36520 [Trinickia violacea]|uniref:Uncharacterized protein n=1 Tax=Trinickia violacea TaxID=2571746 RepID=A0A4P8IYC9_9BURK|nr:tetratricopeptide repeat-containing glycosyltransferase family protein [Trinickia violacea]QCP54428.1 hypothetical protein FAZ95_36520 [Trinickia violacea]